MSSDASLTDRLFRCRQLLEEIFKAVTADSKISFTGLYARMQYAYEASITDSSLNEQLQLLRLLTNKVVHHDDFEFGEGDFASAILILNRTVLALASGRLTANQAVEDFLKQSAAQPLVSQRAVSEQTVAHIMGSVTNWKLSGAKESRRFIEIECQTTDGTHISITLWERNEPDNPGRRWTILDKVLWKFCNISFYSLSQVQGMANRYQSTPLTLVILEQDFLVDVSSVADCFQNSDYYPEAFIINRFFSEPITAPLAKGKCVNHVFDELVRDPARPLKEIFAEYKQDNPHHVFALGEAAWEEIFAQIQTDHYAQLRGVAAELNKQSCQLEPSFISLKYGLHGRLDVMTLPDGKTQKYSIMELKSGSAPPYDIWKAHQMQVVGYNLILKEIFGAANLANSSIFYSRSSQTPLRHVVNNIQAEQDFLMCRNRIIGLMQKLATKPEQFTEWLKTNPRRYPNKFMTEKAEHISATLKGLSKAEMQWLNRSLRFIFREIWAVKTGAYGENETANYGFSALWNCSLVEKKQQYRIIDNLWIENVSADTITFHRQDEITLTNLRVGDIIVLYKQDAAVNEQQLIRGKISYLDDEKIEINTRCRLKQEGVFDNYSLWAIEPDLMESSLYSGISSVYAALCAAPENRAVLLGNRMPEFEDRDTSKIISLREDVATALKGMLTAKDYYLVQGPPGTGKTSCLLMQYIGHVLTESPDRIVILGFTNRSVDEICSQLDKENRNYLRLGTALAAVRTESNCLNPKSQNGNSNHKSQPDYLNHRVYVSTVQSFLAVAPDLLEKITFDQMIIDEASQILEHHVIGLMAKIRKSILIGDQNQLPPIILQDSDEGKASILEKMIANADKKIYLNCYTMLTHHYRMHNDIAYLVGYNYLNRLVADSRRQAANTPWLKTKNAFLEKVFSTRVIWIDTQPSFQSKADAFHANWIKGFIQQLAMQMEPDEISRRIGIISPFRAQGQCIISALGKKIRDITIDTVERYQGSERECIIMSYPVRYHHELAMLQSVNPKGTVDRKLNVALSRAREQLIILGSSKVLTHSEFYHKVYALIQNKGQIIRAEDIIPN